jgi:hypothetical protein
MHLFPTDLDKIDFLLETEAEMLDWQGEFHTTGETADSTLPHTDGADKQETPDTPRSNQETDKPVSEDQPKYVTNYIGSKQKLIEWIWEHTPKDTKTVFDAFNGSAVVAESFFKTSLTNASHIPQWLISYRDHAYPNEEQMKSIIGSLGMSSSLETKDHTYSITSKRGDATNAKEYLFICSKSSAKPSIPAILILPSVPKHNAAMCCFPIGT